jgi:polysaccharide biosynthesis transport protein
VVVVIVAFTLTSFLPATPPASPSSPKPLQSAVVGFGVGLSAGVSLAFVVALLAGIVSAFVVGRFYTRARTRAQAGEILGLAVVGRVPRLRRRVVRDLPLVILTEPQGSVAESLRVLRGNLDRARIGAGWKSVMVTSSRKGEGKTLTLCNLAVTLALTGKKVVVVDADLRDPQVHQAFSMPNETGLTTVIQGTFALAAALRPFDLERSNGSGAVTAADARLVPSADEHGALLVLTSGPLPANPGEVIASQRLAITLKRLANSDADYVLVDGPPLLGTGDAGALAPNVDGLLFVANLDKTRRSTLENGREALHALPCRKLGVVIVGERRGASHTHYDGYSLRENG